MSIQWPDFLPETTGERHFAGTRIALPEFLYFYSTQGYSAEMLALEYPSLDLPMIHKFLAFYLENKRDLDALLAAEQAALDQLRAASPSHIAIADLRKKLAARPHVGSV